MRCGYPEGLDCEWHSFFCLLPFGKRVLSRLLRSGFLLRVRQPGIENAALSCQLWSRNPTHLTDRRPTALKRERKDEKLR